MRIHTANADRVYRDTDTGQPLELTGPLQIVFCDRGNPSTDPQCRSPEARIAVDGSDPEPPRIWYDSTTNFAVTLPSTPADQGE